MIKDLKKLNDTNISLVHNTMEDSTIQLDTLKQLKNRTLPHGAKPSCIYQTNASSSNLASTAKELSKSVERITDQCKNIASISVVNTTKTCPRNNEAILMSMMKASDHSVGDYGRSLSTNESSTKKCNYHETEKSDPG